MTSHGGNAVYIKQTAFDLSARPAGPLCACGHWALVRDGKAFESFFAKQLFVSVLEDQNQKKRTLGVRCGAGGLVGLALILMAIWLCACMYVCTHACEDAKPACKPRAFAAHREAVRGCCQASLCTADAWLTNMVQKRP
jgi:hypothetical protein